MTSATYLKNIKKIAYNFTQANLLLALPILVSSGRSFFVEPLPFDNWEVAVSDEGGHNPEILALSSEYTEPADADQD